MIYNIDRLCCKSFRRDPIDYLSIGQWSIIDNKEWEGSYDKLDTQEVLPSRLRYVRYRIIPNSVTIPLEGKISYNTPRWAYSECN